MLQELRVKNYALLDNVAVKFCAGFSALTGETGAGKSLLVGSLGLLLGEKSQPQSIRYGAEEAEVVGVVRLGLHQQLRLLLREFDISLDDDTLELRRVVRQKGSSSIYANGVRISREQLQSISALLFDLHGQHEHQSLYNQENQRILLDRAARLGDTVQNFGLEFQQLKRKKEQLKELIASQATLEQERRYLEKALQEIEALKPDAHQKAQMVARTSQLENSERLQEKMANAHKIIRVNGPLVLQLKEANTHLKMLSDERSMELRRRLEVATLEIIDIAESLVGMQERLIASPYELEQLQDRLMEYQRLEKKYGSSQLEGLLTFSVTAKERLEVMDVQSNEEEILRLEVQELEQKIRSMAQGISQQRSACASTLEEQIKPLLQELSLPHARLCIEVEARKNSAGERSIGLTGSDVVRFLFSANAGEPLKPLKEVASGGESSRILLILKSLLAHQEEVDCLIFDEIDTGIGGEVARKVAHHMYKLSASKQIICITHLASIAAMAQSQLKIEKQTVDNKTSTTITEIAKEKRVEEIARMLSGSMDELALEHARSLIGPHEEEYNGKEKHHQP
jgi:DNA repair protein RecN (Recombination protein N)